MTNLEDIIEDAREELASYRVSYNGYPSYEKRAAGMQAIIDGAVSELEGYRKRIAELERDNETLRHTNEINEQLIAEVKAERDAACEETRRCVQQVFRDAEQIKETKAERDVLADEVERVTSVLTDRIRSHLPYEHPAAVTAILAARASHSAPTEGPRE